MDHIHPSHSKLKVILYVSQVSQEPRETQRSWNVLGLRMLLSIPSLIKMHFLREIPETTC